MAVGGRGGGPGVKVFVWRGRGRGGSRRYMGPTVECMCKGVWEGQYLWNDSVIVM